MSLPRTSSFQAMCAWCRGISGQCARLDNQETPWFSSIVDMERKVRPLPSSTDVQQIFSRTHRYLFYCHIFRGSKLFERVDCTTGLHVSFGFLLYCLFLTLSSIKKFPQITKRRSEVVQVMVSIDIQILNHVLMGTETLTRQLCHQTLILSMPKTSETL